LRVYTVNPAADGGIRLEPGIRLQDGRFPLPQLQPTDDLLARIGPDGLVERATPYRRLDRDADVINLGPEVLPDVRALLLLDGRGSSSGAFFSFVHSSDTEAGVDVLVRTNAREGQDQRAQMVEVVLLYPQAGVPILVGGNEAHAVVRWDGNELTIEAARPGLARAARPGDVLVPV
jgi:hypothetical protein